jgi:hypothetical protein
LAIRNAQARDGRVVAVGTTVVRTLEDAAALDGSVRSGEGVAALRIGRSSHLHVVDAILSGAHEPGTSHHELLGAFVDDETLSRIDRELDLREYRTHEFGDSVFLEHLENDASSLERELNAVEARKATNMITSPSTQNSQHLYRIDIFKVPPSARDQFLTRVRETHGFLSTLPGFVRHSIFEQSSVPAPSTL